MAEIDELTYYIKLKIVLVRGMKWPYEICGPFSCFSPLIKCTLPGMQDWVK